MKIPSFAQVSCLACVLLSSVDAQDFGDEFPVLDTVTQYRASVIADFDGDGDLDIVGGGSGGPILVLHENAGAGQFLIQRRLGPNPTPLVKNDLEAADLDGDGDLDVLFIGAAPQIVGWIENLGGLEFGPPKVISQGATSAIHLQATDMNSDGLVDVLTTRAGDVVWFPNLGAGSFGPQETLLPSSASSLSIESVDLDGDGDQDVVLTLFGLSEITWIEQTAPGTYGVPVTLTTNIVRPSGLRVVDVDGDGRLDLMADNETSDRVEWVRGLGGLNFGPRRLAYEPPFGTVERYEVADFNGDGLLDVVGLRSSSSEYELVRNQGSIFGSPVSFGSGIQTNGLDAADLDGDGDLDLLSTERERLQDFTWDTGGFEDGRRLNLALGTPPTVRTADLDGDGRSDLILVRGTPEGTYAWFRSEGSGALSTPTQSFSLDNPTQIEPVDMDEDGDLDLVVSGGSFDAFRARIQWVENQGNGLLAPPVEIYANLADSAATFQLEDMDGDGDLDILWYHREGFSFRRIHGWMVQTAPGVFTLGPVLPPNFLTEQFRLGQADGDGFADVFLFGPSIFSPRLTWRAADGLGGFGPETVIRDAPMPPVASLNVEDMDGDGNDDVIVSGVGGAELHLWQPATSSFSGPMQIDFSAGTVPSVILRDVNGDGLKDVLAPLMGLPSRWVANLGGGLFGPPQSLPEVAPGSRVLDVGDYDGDLDMDVLKLDTFGSLAWNANLTRFGEGFCGPAEPNSTGESAAMSASGSLSVVDNDLTLLAEQLPPQAFGYFLVAPLDGFVALAGGSSGNLCLGGAVGRLNRSSAEIFQSGASGSVARTLDLTDVPTPTGAVSLLPGDTRYVQAWFRDASPMPTSNFTNGLRLTFE